MVPFLRIIIPDCVNYKSVRNLVVVCW